MRVSLAVLSGHPKPPSSFGFALIVASPHGGNKTLCCMCRLHRLHELLLLAVLARCCTPLQQQQPCQQTAKWRSLFAALALHCRASSGPEPQELPARANSMALCQRSVTHGLPAAALCSERGLR